MSSCPDISVLHRLEAGDLTDEEADGLAPHLERCASCLETLDRLRGDDLDARVLRGAMRDSKGDASPHADPAASTVGMGDAGPDRSGRVWDIPDYDRIRFCGAGAFGSVWAVRDRLGMHRALKTMDLSRLRSANVRCRESTALEAYCRRVRRHPNLIEIFHVGMQGSMLYYTMELADDDRTRRPVRDHLPESYRPLTLDQVIRKGPTSPNTAIEVVLRLLRGLSRLHEVGMAHRDIKPANIVFVDKQPKLADIGMITADTATASQVGTPDYMPPDGKMDETSDVYAMGHVLHKMLVGAAGDEFPRLPAAVCNARGNWNMEKIGHVLETTGAANAADRYPSADRMVEAIESCRDLSFDSLLADLAPMASATPATSHNPWQPVVLAAINALPWVFGALAAIFLIGKLL